MKFANELVILVVNYEKKSLIITSLPRLNKWLIDFETWQTHEIVMVSNKWNSVKFKTLHHVDVATISNLFYFNGSKSGRKFHFYHDENGLFTRLAYSVHKSNDTNLSNRKHTDCTYQWFIRNSVKYVSDICNLRIEMWSKISLFFNIFYYMLRSQYIFIMSHRDVGDDFRTLLNNIWIQCKHWIRKTQPHKTNMQNKKKTREKKINKIDQYERVSWADSISEMNFLTDGKDEKKIHTKIRENNKIQTLKKKAKMEQKNTKKVLYYRYSGFFLFLVVFS